MKRRDFIKGIGLFSGFMMLGGVPLQAFSRPLVPNWAQANGKKLVMIQLGGGNDGLNTIVPFEDSKYYNARPKIAIPKKDVLKITDLQGFHPNMTGFKSLYDEGKMNIVQGVGYTSPNRSHFRSTDIWLSGSEAHEYLHEGWMSRYLAQIYPDFPTTVAKHPMAIQLGSVQSLLYSSDKGDMGVAFDTPDNFYRLVQGSSVDSDIPPNTLAGIELKFIKQISAESIQYAGVIKTAADKASNKVTYPNTNLGKQMAIIAELIAGGLETSLYLATIGGFDTHANQLVGHGNLLKDVSDAVSAFMKDLQAQSLSQDVVVMTFSEFGRRVNENGSLGTDHGTAAPMFFIGDMVKAGFIGNVPSLTDLDEIQDLKFQYEFKQVYSTVLRDYLGADSTLAQKVLGKTFDNLPIFRKDDTLSIREDAILNVDLQNYPNPFVETTKISFDLRQSGEISLKIFYLAGREVVEIAKEYLASVAHTYTWECANMPTGMYLCVLTQENKTAIRRLLKQ